MSVVCVCVWCELDTLVHNCTDSYRIPYITECNVVARSVPCLVLRCQSTVVEYLAHESHDDAELVTSDSSSIHSFVITYSRVKNSHFVLPSRYRLSINRT